MYGQVHSIESLGTVDGPGVRYVIFLQGCPMRCAYCHNPDTWEVRGGKSMSVEEILNGFDKVKSFLKNGGITVTGGEPLLQMEFVTELMKQAKSREIHTCVDTSGITFRNGDSAQLKQFDELISYVDLFLLDIKQIRPDKHRELTGQPNEGILEFAKYLSDHEKSIWIRHVVVPGITDVKEDLYELGYFIGGLQTVKALDVLPYHSMGKVKYEAMGLSYRLSDVPDLEKEKAVDARNEILNGILQRRVEEREKMRE